MPQRICSPMVYLVCGEKPVERGHEHNHGLLAAWAFSFVSFCLIQSETTQHAKLKLAGKKKGVSE